MYLKRVTRTGSRTGCSQPGGPTRSSLNVAPYDKGSVLVAGPDFGTGSSREHALWALSDYGFPRRHRIAFRRLFRGNAGKAGLLAAQVEQSDVEMLWKLLEEQPGLELVVDLASRP